MPRRHLSHDAPTARHHLRRAPTSIEIAFELCAKRHRGHLVRHGIDRWVHPDRASVQSNGQLDQNQRADPRGTRVSLGRFARFPIRIRMDMTAEHLRLQESRHQKASWKKWGPYLSERQWGTVREDYSASGDAWDYFTHDQARPRAYRWGEDGLAGISDDQQLSASRLRFGMGRIRFSRNGCSVSPTARAITART